MFECPTCKVVLDGSDKYRGSNRHVRKCKAASDKDREYFKANLHWPKKRRIVRVASNAD